MSYLVGHLDDVGACSPHLGSVKGLSESHDIRVYSGRVAHTLNGSVQGIVIITNESRRIGRLDIVRQFLFGMAFLVEGPPAVFGGDQNNGVATLELHLQGKRAEGSTAKTCGWSRHDREEYGRRVRTK